MEKNAVLARNFLEQQKLKWKKMMFCAGFFLRQ